MGAGNDLSKSVVAVIAVPTGDGVGTIVLLG